jgi:hypothetical protein
MTLEATSECAFCKAHIVWARTAFNGTPISVDVLPDGDGSIVIEERGNRLIATVLPPNDPRLAEESTYTAHHSTCPDQDQWRKRHHA